jgi:hypothetical protein
MNIPFRLFCATLLSLSASQVLATPVLNSGTVYSFVNDAAYGSQTGSAGLATGSASASATVGTASATTQGTVTATGNSLSVDYSFVEHLDAPHPTLVSYYDWWYGYVSYWSGDMYAQSLVNGSFTLDAGDVGYTYELTADFDQSGTSQMTLFANLYDMTAYGALYDLYQYNTVSTDGSMALGTGAQGFNYAPIGATSGDLIAGHTYSYVISSMVRHYQAAAGETVTDAQGTFGIRIQGPQAVPEPSGLLLAGLGLAGCWLAVRKRAAKRA